MKCPYCGELLGLNNICINVTCSHFSTTIISSKDSMLNEFNEDNLKSKNSNINEISNEKYHLGNNNNKSSNKYNNTHHNYNNYSNSSNNSYNLNNFNNRSSYENKSFNFHNNHSSNISKEELVAFIGGNNTQYYLKYTHKHENNKRFISWNWPCFFLGNYWLLYRKLYFPALGLMSLTFIFSEIFGSKTKLFLLLLMHIILALFANSMYLNKCERKIKKIQILKPTLNPSQYMRKLHEKGGVNLILPILLLIISILGTMIYIIALLSNIAHQPPLHSPSHYF